MAVRVLSQVTVSFLLGIMAARWGRLWGYGLCAAWLVSVGILTHGACRRWEKDTAGQLAVGNLRFAIRVLVCLIACWLGSVRYESQQQIIVGVEQYLSQQSRITATGTIHKKEEKNQQISYYLKHSYIMSEAGAIKSSQILVYSETDDFSIGDTITVTGTGEGFEGARNEGNFDSKSYYYSKNVLCRIWADKLTLVKRPAFLWREALYGLRKNMQEIFVRQLPGEAAGVLGVMTLGEKELLDAEVKKLYQQSGISHVLAISGLHVSILGAGVYRFLRKRGLSYLWSGTIAGILVFCFGQLSGMELSTGRAVLMFFAMLLGNVLGMAYDSVTPLSLSALLQLWENPLCLWYAGFLFSYSAVLAVVVAVRILQNAFAGQPEESGAEKSGRKGKRNVREQMLIRKKGLKGRLIKGKRELMNTFFVSSCIQLVTLPLTVYFYYEFPLYSVFINGLLLPFMGVILMSGILGGLAGVFAVYFGGPAEIVFQGLSFLLLRPAYVLLEWNRWICSLFAKLPGAMQITGKPELWMMVSYYTVLMVVLWLMYRRNAGRKIKEGVANAGKPEGQKVTANGRELERKERRFFCLCADRLALLAVAVAALTGVVFYRPHTGFQVCFLDVGQGDGIYIQAEDGSRFFIDGGSTDEKQVGEYRILSFLKCCGARKVDGWFVSHGDNDHISGLKEVLESGYRVEHLFFSRWIPRDEAWEELCRVARQYGTKIVYLNPGDVVGGGELSVTCVYPWEEMGDRNNASMALYFSAPYLSAFFGGDMETKAEKRLAEQYAYGAVDLYKAIHHGSDGSNGEALLEMLRPKVSVVSCGEKNSYGHPGKEAVGRLEACGSQIFYTMKGGQITVGGDERGIWVREFVGEK